MGNNLESRLAVCSWSLRASGPEHLVELVAACGVHGVQLHLDPVRRGEWDIHTTQRALADRGIRVVSGMISMLGEDYSSLESIERTGGIRSDATWKENLAAAESNADVAATLGIKVVTFHAGFFPEEAGEHAVLIERVRMLAGVFARRGVGLALETGQETAETLAGVLGELDGVGVNFDPGNMVLYGMGDPVAALRELRPHVVQVHVKDALSSAVRGQWGTETPVGEGSVDWRGFFDVVPDVDLVIERESGEARVADVRAAAALVRRLLGGGGG